MHLDMLNSHTLREESVLWHELFYWLTPSERSSRALADHPAFPGLFPGEEENGRFAETMRRASSRKLDCSFHLPWGRVSGCLEVVSGAAYIYEDGRPSLAEEFNGFLNVTFDAPGASLFQVEFVEGFIHTRQDDRVFDKDRVTGGELTSARAQRVDVYELQRVLHLLEQEGKLPPVEASFNGKRWGTFHQLSSTTALVW